MIIKSSTVTLDDIERIGDALGIETRGRHASGKPEAIGHDRSGRTRYVVRLRARSGSDMYRLIRPRRRTAATCYHGAGAFLERVFDIDPDAIVESGVGIVNGSELLVYNGRADFHAVAAEIASRNIGSQVEPVRHDAACKCGKPDGVAQVWRPRNANDLETRGELASRYVEHCPHCRAELSKSDPSDDCEHCGENLWRVASTTFTTQEGAVFGMDGATCPNGHASSLAHRVYPSGYFRCPECGTLYDEPTFDPTQYVETLDEEVTR